jgi:hypothetical protein
LGRRLPLLGVLWLGSSLFFLGDLGKYADDYFFAGRDPATGAPVAATALWARPFYRPLAWVLVPGLERLFWFDDAWLHVVSAAAHGLAVALLAALLLALGRSRVATLAAVGLFLVAPAHYEVVFWPAALPTGLASSLFLTVCLLTVRRARRRGGDGGRDRAFLCAIGVAAAAIPCLNEQAAAGLLALPLLHLAAAPRRTSREGRRPLAATLAAWTGPALYGVLFWATSRPGMRGTQAVSPPTAALPGEAARLAGEGLARLCLRDFGSGALIAGFESLRAYPLRSAALLVAFSASAWLALRPRSSASGRSPGERSPDRPAAALAFGLAVFLLDWIPLLVVAGMAVSSRLTYAPSLGLAIAAAAAIDLVDRPLRWTAAYLSARRLGALALTGVLALGLVAMIGIQARFRARSHADRELAAELRRAVPDPAPDALFLVLGDARRGTTTGAAHFDGALPSPLSLRQAATPFVRWVYRRRDLYAAQLMPWIPVAIAETTPDGPRLIGLEPAFPLPMAASPRGGVVVPWGNLVPLRIGVDGEVELVSRSEVRP